MSQAFLRFAVGFVAVAFVALSVSLYLSVRYLEEQQRLYNRGDFAGAIQHAEIAARLDPFSAEPLEAKAFLQQQQGKNSEAESTFEAAAERESADYEIPASLGEHRFLYMDAPLKAAEAYERAVELSPASTSSRIMLASTYLSAGKLERAKREYEKLQKDGELDDRMLYDLGRIYVRTDEPQKGIETLRQTKNRVEDGLQGLSGEQRQQQIDFLTSVELALADALVADRRYEEARRVAANSSAEQAPTILNLISSDPEGYRQTVINSDVY